MKDTGKDGENFSLISAGIEDTSFGYYLKEDKTGNTAVLKKGMEVSGDFSFRFHDLSYAVNNRLNQVQIAIKYDYPGKENGKAVVVLGSGKESVKHSVVLLKGVLPSIFIRVKRGLSPTQ